MFERFGIGLDLLERIVVHRENEFGIDAFCEPGGLVAIHHEVAADRRDEHIGAELGVLVEKVGITGEIGGRVVDGQYQSDDLAFGEQFCVSLDGIAIDLDAVVGMENPFDAVERIPRSVIETQINDRLTVETLLVEQFGHIAIDWFLAVFVPVALHGNGDLFEAVLSE